MRCVGELASLRGSSLSSTLLIYTNVGSMHRVFIPIFALAVLINGDVIAYVLLQCLVVDSGAAKQHLGVVSNYI